ncbi:MAG: sigma factor G inhibitor Gin [Desulfotomaculaceae bacterium]|nr:sigma factor G inhibitor Gin [Desulfotomaculaceae bacterium]MDD4766883.1 sigma factor G inhibitor Gin [Desulfotomaculaceae bacterium]
MAAESQDCILCRRSCLDGKQGLYVRGCHICRDCEEKIISIAIDDPIYQIYIKKLKKIWSQAG